MKEVTAKSYTLRTKDGYWLGQVVLTSDGAFMAITDYGNFNFAWRSHGEEDFRDFMIRINQEYFAGKMYQGMQYVAHGSKVQKQCEMFAKNVLPTLQTALKAELETERRAPAKTEA